MTKCNVCGYDDKGTGDSAHVCNPPAKHMSQDKIAFEKWFESRYVHPSESTRIVSLKAWEAATAEANKRNDALESEVAELKERKGCK